MSATSTLWNKHMRKSLTNPEEAIGMLIQPVLWVVLFGIGMGSLLGATEPGAEDTYITFMLPESTHYLRGYRDAPYDFRRQRHFGDGRYYTLVELFPCRTCLPNFRHDIGPSSFQEFA